MKIRFDVRDDNGVVMPGLKKLSEACVACQKYCRDTGNHARVVKIVEFVEWDSRKAYPEDRGGIPRS
jgi:hypothetical protein